MVFGNWKRKASRKSRDTGQDITSSASKGASAISAVPGKAASSVASPVTGRVDRFKSGRNFKGQAKQLNWYEEGQYEESVQPQVEALSASMGDLRDGINSTSSGIKSAIKVAERDRKSTKKSVYQYEDSLVKDANTNAAEKIKEIKQNLKNAKTEAIAKAEEIISILDETKTAKVNSLKAVAEILKQSQKDLSKLENRFKNCKKILRPNVKNSNKINQQELCFQELSDIMEIATQIQADINEVVKSFNDFVPRPMPAAPENTLYNDPTIPQDIGTYESTNLASVDVNIPTTFNYPERRELGRRAEAVPEAVPDVAEPVPAVEGGGYSTQDGGMHLRTAYNINKNKYHDLVLRQIMNDL
jgi:hypothetical protein